MPGELDRQRLDKWLWAARFFKTRSLANEAIAGGKVRVNGAGAKPAKEISAGDRLDIAAAQNWTVIVRGLNLQRRPAPEARLLWEETEDSRQRREAAEELQRLAPPPGADLRGRPTKRDGRRLRGLSG